MMETRHQRAKRDARPWRLSLKDLAYSIVGGLLTFLTLVIIRRRADVVGLLIPAAVVIGAAILIPVGVYVGSWLTAVSRIHRDELTAIRGEVAALTARLERRQGETEAVNIVKGVRSLADVIGTRVQPWGTPPASLEQEVDTWIEAVSVALAPWPGLQAQFDGVSDENPAVAAVLKSNALSIRFANHKTTLDAIIKHLSQVADLDAQGASS